MKDLYVTPEEAFRMWEEGPLAMPNQVFEESQLEYGKEYYLLSGVYKRLGFYTKEDAKRMREDWAKKNAQLLENYIQADEKATMDFYKENNNEQNND